MDDENETPKLVEDMVLSMLGLQQPNTEDSSNSSGEGGNTITPSPPAKKQVSPAIRWCFTLNNYTEEHISSIVSVIQEKCRLGIFGKETGESGTPHLQGYIEFITKARPRGVFGIPEIHWEKCKGSRSDNIIYCSKDDMYPYCFGCNPHRELKVISHSNLYPWQRRILKCIGEVPDDRTINWYWSEKGGIGKTQFCKYLTFYHNAICVHGKGGDVRNAVCSYLEKEGMTPELIVFPIPRCYGGDYVSYEALENIKDMYFYSGKYEGGMVIGNSPHLIVFANNEPDYDKMSGDRWNVVQLDDEEDE